MRASIWLMAVGLAVPSAVAVTACTPPPSQASCNPNYTPCVPNASDVDCASGTGNGPVYIDYPVRVVGVDVYDLDQGGEPGIGCENG
jgi:resuscitation-promoting factor RpfB